LRSTIANSNSVQMDVNGMIFTHQELEVLQTVQQSRLSQLLGVLLSILRVVQQEVSSLQEPLV